MRVVALGGAGGMGRHAVRTAVEYDFVDRVLVADLDEGAAASFADTVGPKAQGVGIDVSEADALAGLLEAADVVLNTVGPFYRFGSPVLRAAIDAGCHYLDINDDWEPTLAMLELDSEARAAGVSAIVGLGASPGVSNLLAVKAMQRLDRTTELITGWGVGGGAAREQRSERPQSEDRPRRQPSAALVHWMHQCSGTIRQKRDGELVDLPPVEELRLDYPGIGTASAWTVGHPEAVTFARSRPELERCVNVMCGPRWLMDVVKALGREIDAGRLDPEDAAAQMTGPPPEARERPPSQEPTEPRLPPLFALVRGTRDGRPASAATTILGAPRGGMGGITGVPLAIGLELLASGTIERRGVFAPEDAVDPDLFFDALAPRCTPPLSSGEKLVALSES